MKTDNSPFKHFCATPLSSALMLAGTMFLAAVPTTAFADCEGCVPAINDMRSAVVSTIKNQQSTVVDRMVDSTRSILQAMGNATDSIAKNATAVAKQRGDDTARIAKAQAKQQAAIAGQQSVANMSCSAVSSTISGGNAPGGSKTNVGPAGSGKSDYSTAGVSQRLGTATKVSGNASEQEIAPVTESQQAADLGVGACQSFGGDANSARGKLCALANIQPEAMSPYPNADVDAQTLFYGPQSPGAPQARLTVSGSGPMRDARKAFLTAATTPVPPATPNTAAVKTPAYKVYLGRYTEYAAAMSLAAQPLYDWDTWTTTDKSTADALTAIASDPNTGVNFLSQYAKANGVTSFSDGVSQAELMKIEVERRVGNKDWVLNMAKASAEDKQAESLLMQAYSMRMEFDRLVEQKKTNVLLGKLLATSVNATLRKDLDASIDLANNAGNSVTGQK